MSTKEAAQKALGMDMDKMNAEKQHFRYGCSFKWEEQAEKREANYEY
ncbi:hypothetical protein O9929_20075 [Vibrio lentus]|nr:hypothetical protein [Vibrio lentus]